MSTKKQTKSGVKAKGQHYCYCCGVICGTKYTFTDNTTELARTTVIDRHYSCSMTCMKALIFRQQKKHLGLILEAINKDNFVFRKQLLVDIAQGVKTPKPILILAKSNKTITDICDLLLKQDWLKSGLLYMKSKDLFTEAGEILLPYDDKKYLSLLNVLEVIKQIGGNLMEVLTANRDGCGTIDTQGLWS